MRKANCIVAAIGGLFCKIMLYQPIIHYKKWTNDPILNHSPKKHVGKMTAWRLNNLGGTCIRTTMRGINACPTMSHVHQATKWQCLAVLIIVQQNTYVTPRNDHIFWGGGVAKHLYLRNLVDDRAGLAPGVILAQRFAVVWYVVRMVVVAVLFIFLPLLF